MKLSIKEYLLLRKEGYTSEEIAEYKAELEASASSVGTEEAEAPAGAAETVPAEASLPSISDQIKSAVAEAMAELHINNVSSSGAAAGDPPTEKDPIEALADYFSSKG